MGHCCSKGTGSASAGKDDVKPQSTATAKNHKWKPPSPGGPAGASSSDTPVYSFTGSPWQIGYPEGIGATPSPAGTPKRIFKWPFPPPSPAKPIMSAIRKRQQSKKGKPGATVTIPEDDGKEGETPLDKNFGFPTNFRSKYELGKEVGRGHFGHTCRAKCKKGAFKNEYVAVKIIPKSKMTTAISIEDVRREVKLLKSLSGQGHKHMVQFYDAFEDDQNVYIFMELCEGGELLDRILSRGGRYYENDAKSIVRQILSAASFTHLQGVVHRDLKPENFLFSTKDEDSLMKLIDFGLSDFVRPDQRLNDIVGSAYYVAPEVLHRSYNVEADMWSIGVITYILLCGSRPFFARTESGIFRSVVKADPNLTGSPWPSVTPKAKDFVKRLLNKDHRKRMTASQALTHPWLRDENHDVPLDILVYKLVKSYVRATPLRRAALKALSKALTEDELIYLSAQFNLLEPKDGCVSLENFKMALVKHSTAAMKESRVFDILDKMKPLSYTQMTFEEFSAAAINPHQLEALEEWETMANNAFQYFELEGNRSISIYALAQEMNVGEAAHPILKDWIRSSDGKLSFLGYTKFLHGLSIRSSNTRQQQ